METQSLRPAGMDASDREENDVDNLYRFRSGSSVIYVVVEPHCVLIQDVADYGFPPAIRRLLPPTIPPSHNLVNISRCGAIATSCKRFADVKVETLWHPLLIDVSALQVVRALKPRVFKVKYGSHFAIAKIARFEFEIPYIQTETEIYRLIDGEEIGPKFLAHLTENGRTMGFLIEYLDSHCATTADFSKCTAVLVRLHSLQLVHGDINRNNFLIVGDEAKLIDFDSCVKGSEEMRAAEFDRLHSALMEDSYRGAPWLGQDLQEDEYTNGI